MNEGRKVTVATPDELKERGTDTISVRLESGVSASAAADLETDLGAYAHEVTTSGETLEVRVDDGGSTAPRLLNDLEARGHEIADLEITRTSLEEIFVDLTRSEDRTVTRSSASSADEGEESETTPAEREQEGVA